MMQQPKSSDIWQYKPWWIAAAVVLLLLIWLGLSTRQQTPPPALTDADSGVRVTSSVTALPKPAMETTQPDSQQQPGNPLVLNEQLKWQFDDLIHSADGDDTKLPKLLGELALSLNLSDDAELNLMDLFSRYRQYLMAVAELKQGVNTESLLSADDTRSFLRRAHALQFEFFSDPEIAAFFGDANRYDQQALARMTAQAGHDASSLKQQLDSLPEQDREILLPSVQALALTESLSGQQAPADLTFEQQQKLQDFQHQNLKWQQRVEAVVKLQQQLADTQDADLILADYLASGFTLAERRRLDVFLRHPELLNLQGNE
ncbi:lipase chaperone [Shewanella submarina]|uniref:Lipase chaperone n=1 Tax=Shewanella submarina TaxID=2016376 RepID=A0ABV7GC40_9GAMM|nr:lipase chaperone [Shewanella submarina]MCL1036771.1 lipase chaperone [Shewanella submarina]